jgi:hypothetical protein
MRLPRLTLLPALRDGAASDDALRAAAASCAPTPQPATIIAADTPPSTLADY